MAQTKGSNVYRDALVTLDMLNAELEANIEHFQREKVSKKQQIRNFFYSKFNGDILFELFNRVKASPNCGYSQCVSINDMIDNLVQDLFVAFENRTFDSQELRDRVIEIERGENIGRRQVFNNESVYSLHNQGIDLSTINVVHGSISSISPIKPPEVERRFNWTRIYKRRAIGNPEADKPN